MDANATLPTTPASVPRAHSAAATSLRASADGRRCAISWQVPEEIAVGLVYNRRPYAVMMATPADLEDFAVGFTLTEGLLEDAGDITSIEVADVANGIQVLVETQSGRLTARINDKRTVEGRSGCGLCGISTLEAAMRPLRPVPAWRALPHPDAIRNAYQTLPQFQVMNRVNRSVHAAALCDLQGNVLLCREDVGRHNALDKVLGAAIRSGKAGNDGFIVMSSRCSYELVAKCSAVGMPMLATISAPTALALSAARGAGITLAACAGGTDVAIFDCTPRTAITGPA